MSWFHQADDGGRDYYDSDGMGSYVVDEDIILNEDDYDSEEDDFDFNDENDENEDEDSDDDDSESRESDSLRRRNIISGLHASSLQYLGLAGELWESSVTMESFQPDMENIIVALQSNRSLESIEISREILAAIGEANEDVFSIALETYLPCNG
jgi:hypothetical protein